MSPITSDKPHCRCDLQGFSGSPPFLIYRDGSLNNDCSISLHTVTEFKACGSVDCQSVWPRNITPGLASCGCVLHTASLQWKKGKIALSGPIKYGGWNGLGIPAVRGTSALSLRFPAFDAPAITMPVMNFNVLETRCLQ